MLEDEEDEEHLDFTSGWNFGLCSCYKNIPVCLLTCICPWITEVLIAHEAGLFVIARFILYIILLALLVCLINVLFQIDFVLDVLQIFQEPNMESVDKVNANGASAIAFILVFIFILIFLSIGHFVLVVLMRREVRRIYRIRGSNSDDCCVVSCCHNCATCQMYQEVQYRNEQQFEQQSESGSEMSRE